MTSLVLPAIRSTFSTTVVGSGVPCRKSLRFSRIWHTSRCPATQSRAWHCLEQYQPPPHKHLRHLAASMQITQRVRLSSFDICPSSRSTDPSGAVIRSILAMALLLAHSTCTDTDYQHKEPGRAALEACAVANYGGRLTTRCCISRTLARSLIRAPATVIGTCQRNE